MMKKLILLFAIIFLGLMACEKDEMQTPVPLGDPMPRVPTVLNNDDLDCPDIKMVPLKGYTIEVPFFGPESIFCGSIPYPNGFRDIAGEINHLGDVTGGYLEFFSCTPGMLGDVMVFTAECTGEFLAANGDKVFYEGTLTFASFGEIEGISHNYITGGTGRWEDAQGCFRYYNITPQEDGTLKALVEGEITPPGVAKKSK